MRMLIEIVRQSLATLWAHKLRSFLTMFGIAWGVGSLLLLVGLGEGFRSGQAKQLKNLGQDIMFTFPGRIPAVEGSTQSGPARRARLRIFLRYSIARIFAPSAIMVRPTARSLESRLNTTRSAIFRSARGAGLTMRTIPKRGEWRSSAGSF